MSMVSSASDVLSRFGLDRLVNRIDRINGQLDRAVNYAGRIPFRLWNVCWRRGGGQREIVDLFQTQVTVNERQRTSADAKSEYSTILMRCDSVSEVGETESVGEEPKNEIRKSIILKDLGLKDERTLEVLLKLAVSLNPDTKDKTTDEKLTSLLGPNYREKMNEQLSEADVQAQKIRLAHYARYNYFQRHGKESSAEPEAGIGLSAPR